MARHIIVMFCFSVLIVKHLTAAVTIIPSTSTVEKYHVYEIEFHPSESFHDPFQNPNIHAVFSSPVSEQFTVYGFYDGDQIYKIRFMPNRIGNWQVNWNFNGESGSLNFSCTFNSNSKIHGHLRVDSDNNRKLRYEDGTPMFYHGGKYLCMKKAYGTDDMQELSYPERLSTSDYLYYVKKYLGNIAELGLNAVLFKIQVLPLDYDLKTMDLEFLQTLDEIVETAMHDGINVQLNLFDPWGKRKQGTDWQIITPSSADELFLEPWDPGTFKAATQFYIEYIVNRYAAFPNVYWEMFNEAEKLKVSASPASNIYKSIIRNADPYDLIIGSSEMYTAPYNQDAVFVHMKYKCWPDNWDYIYHAVENDRRYAPYFYNYDKPYIWNEIGPWESSDYTETQRQDWFRSMFWSALTIGSAGISEDHWTDIRYVPDKISDYHGHFIKFVNQLTDINALSPNTSSMYTLHQDHTVRFCQNDWKEMVAYIYTQKYKSETDFNVFLRAGRYWYQYYNPSTGEWIGEAKIRTASTDKWKLFTTPVYHDDIVFYLVEENYGAPSTTPVEWETLNAFVEDEQVRLEWSTATESNNYGFEISRSADNVQYEKIGFVKGHDTTSEQHDYHFIDYPQKNGNLSYQIKQIDTDGTTDIQYVEVEFTQIEKSKLGAHPNPSRGTTFIQFQLQQQQDLTLVLYNTLGQEIRRIDLAYKNSGMHSVLWDGFDQFGQQCATGTFFYRIYGSQKTQQPIASGQFIRIK